MANEIVVRILGKDSASRTIAQVESLTTKFGGTLRRVGEQAAGFLSAQVLGNVAGRFANFVGGSITAATSLGESLNAVNKIFGTSAKQITDWGEKNANAFGLSRASFNQLATPLGAMLKNAGIALDLTAESTINLTKRAADMASVFNTDVDEALMAIQAGLRGEADPLERFGVGLNAAKVEAEALAMSGKSVAKELTDQEKMLARINLIMAQTASVEGDFADTSNELANATRIKNARFEEMQVALGQKLVPVMLLFNQAQTKAIDGAFALMAGLDAVGGFLTGEALPFAAAAVAAATFALAAKGAAIAVVAIGNATVASIASLKSMIVTLRLLVMYHPLIAGLTLAVGALTFAFFSGRKEAERKKKAIDELATAMHDLGDEYKAVEDLVTKQLTDDERLRRTLLDIGISARVLTEALDGGDDAWERFLLRVQDAALGAGITEDAWHDMLVALVEMRETTAGAKDKQDELSKSLEGTTSAADEEKNALGDLSDQQEKTKTTTEVLEEAQEKLFEAMRDVVDTAFLAQDATVAWEGSLDALREAITQNAEETKRHGATIDLTTEAGRRQHDMLKSLVDAGRSRLEVLVAEGASEEYVTGQKKLMVDEMARELIAMGYSIEQAYAYVDALNAIPTNVTTEYEVESAAAIAALDELIRKGEAAAYAGRQALLAGQGSGSTPRPTGYASGVRNAPGGWAWVGESGPELMRVPAGADIYSSAESRAMVSAGGTPVAAIGGGQPIDLTIMLDSEVVGRATVKASNLAGGLPIRIRAAS